METLEFVLVHGGGHGKWCWQRTLQLLHAAGFKAMALDLATDDDSITSFHRYTQPLIDYLNERTSQPKVILVGHSLAGLSLGKAMELFPHRICAAVFVAAFMPPTGHAFCDLLTEAWEYALIKAEQVEYEFGCPNSGSAIPIAVKFPPDILRSHYYQLCSPEDREMGCTLVKRSPVFIGDRDRTEYSKQNYGRVPRAYVSTAQDRVLTTAFQDLQLRRNPPHHVFELDSDHSPFFSAPQRLHEILVKMASLYPKISSKDV